jgi:hypothetical protein
VAVGSAGWLAGCRPESPTAGTPIPSSTPTVTAISQPAALPDSTVVRVRDPRAWKNGQPDSLTLRAMLDNGALALTGTHDPHQAWAGLFTPEERIAIKVNTIRDSAV